MRLCDGCGRPFSSDEWENRHTAHESSCPYKEDFPVDCDCDLAYHDDCCPECNDEPPYEHSILAEYQ